MFPALKEFVYSQRTGLPLGSSSRPSLLPCLEATSYFSSLCVVAGNVHPYGLVPRTSAARLLPQAYPGVHPHTALLVLLFRQATHPGFLQSLLA